MITVTTWEFEYNVLTVKMQGCLSLKLFLKTFQYPIVRSQYYKLGDLVNMMQVDIIQVANYFKSVQQSIVLPLFLLAAFYVNYSLVKSKCVVGTVVGLCQLFFNAAFGYLYGRYQKKFMHGKDLRLRALDEMVSGIKTIKYNSYEDMFEKRIKEKRNYEMNRLMKQNVMTVVINFLNLLLPTLVVFLTTIIYNINSLEEFFIVQQAFNTISFYLSMLPAAVQGTVIGISSLKRMNAFFENDEYTQSSL